MAGADRCSRENIMRALIIVSALLISTLSANATMMYRYHDVRNRQQHDSSDTATEKCDPFHQQAYDSRAFNTCMLAHGWRFNYIEHIEDDDQSSDGYVSHSPQFDSDGALIPGSDR
jgi:hypothetical protein